MCRHLGGHSGSKAAGGPGRGHTHYPCLQVSHLIHQKGNMRSHRSHRVLVNGTRSVLSRSLAARAQGAEGLCSTLSFGCIQRAGTRCTLPFDALLIWPKIEAFLWVLLQLGASHCCYMDRLAKLRGLKYEDSVGVAAALCKPSQRLRRASA